MTLERVLKKYKAEDISISFLVREAGDHNPTESFKTLVEHNPDTYFHPASLLKLFITTMANKLYPSPEEELTQAINETIIHSDNDALAYLIDYLAPYPWDYNSTDSKNTLQELCESRLKINQFFIDSGFSADINLANKCFSFDYYGKEKEIYKELGANQITNRDLSKLLILIEKGFPLIMQAMQRTLNDENAEIGVRQESRNISSSIIDTDTYQVEAFAGKILRDKLGLKQIYSKAGWNSRVRHDAAIFTLDDRTLSESQTQNKKTKTYILSILTKNLSHCEEILQELVSETLSYIL